MAKLRKIRNTEKVYRECDREVECFEDLVYGDVMPSRRFYSGHKNRNDEICMDKEFEGIYGWKKVDEEKAAEEYRGMIGEFRKRYGLK